MIGASDPRPRRRVAVVACFDARIDPRAALGYDLGDAHIFRNAGAVVTDDVLRSLALSQHALGTTEVHLIAHTGCGLATTTDEELGELVERATGTRPELAWGAFDDAVAHLRAGADRIAACSFLRTENIRASILDTETGALRDVTLERQPA